jgi:hypothetical protein
MKNNIAFFLLGIFLIILTSATTVSVMTVKSATPKYFIVESFKAETNSGNVALFINDKMRQGWILKSVEGANWSTNQSTWIVVLEKY